MKQVIVMRTDLNMRKGKMVAQGGHAVLGVFIGDNISKESLSELISNGKITLTETVVKWLISGMKKVTLGCKSEEELMDLYTKARAANLSAYYVKDAGHTELLPGTITCMAIGPADEEEIDKITGHLKLL